MMCDKARAILGGVRKAAKHYVMKGEGRVMSWSDGMMRRPFKYGVWPWHSFKAFASLRLCDSRRLHEEAHFSQRRKGGGIYFSKTIGLSNTSAMVSNAAAARDAAVRTWFQAVQPPR